MSLIAPTQPLAHQDAPFPEAERRVCQTELARAAAFDHIAAERFCAIDFAARLAVAANPRLQQERS